MNDITLMKIREQSQIEQLYKIDRLIKLATHNKKENDFYRLVKKLVEMQYSAYNGKAKFIKEEEDYNIYMASVELFKADETINGDPFYIIVFFADLKENKGDKEPLYYID